MKIRELINPYFAVALARPWMTNSLKFLLNSGITLLVLAALAPANHYALLVLGLLLLYTPNTLLYLNSKYQ